MNKINGTMYDWKTMFISPAGSGKSTLMKAHRPQAFCYAKMLEVGVFFAITDKLIKNLILLLIEY